MSAKHERVIASLFAALVATACSSEAPDSAPVDAGMASQEAFLFASNVVDGESSNTYVLVLSELGGEVDLARGLEVPGSSSVFSELGDVFIANGEDMTVTRYAVDAQNQLVSPRRFSMAGQGVTAIDASLFFVLDAERAYYIDSNGSQIIVWNPTRMEISEVVPFIDLNRNGFYARVYGFNAASAWLLAETGVLYLPVAWTDSDTLTAEPLLALLSISGSDPREQELHTSDCAAVSEEGLLLGLDGNIYLAGTNGWTILREFGDMPESAIAKFDMTTQSFDPDYCQSIPALTGGHEAGTLIAYTPGEFVVRAVDKSLTTIGDSGTYYGDIGNACRFYHGAIDAQGELAIVEQPALGTAPHYCWGWVYKLDGSPYFWGEDTMFRWNGTAMEPLFESPGYAVALARIR